MLPTTQSQRSKRCERLMKLLRAYCKRASSCAECEVGTEFGTCPILNIDRGQLPSEWKFYDEEGTTERAPLETYIKIQRQRVVKA